MCKHSRTNLKDSTHPITQTNHLKYNTTQKAHNTSQQLLEKNHSRAAALKKNYELKEMEMSTNTQFQEKQKQQLQNISL
jgi:hypothetical protein